jgi:hypothetical protein
MVWLVIVGAGLACGQLLLKVTAWHAICLNDQHCNLVPKGTYACVMTRTPPMLLVHGFGMHIRT